MAYENAFITIMLVGLVFFGSKKLPELVRARALSSREVKSIVYICSEGKKSIHLAH